MSRDDRAFTPAVAGPENQVSELLRELASLRAELAVERAEKSRLSAELGLRDAALDAGTSHFVIVDATRTTRPIAYINKACANAHGYRTDELLGESARKITFRQKKAVANVQEFLKKMLQGESVREEAEIVRRDGTSFWGGFVTTPLFDGKGKMTHWVTVGADITARREAEARRAELQEQLYSEMRERERMSIELRLAQKLESVGRLAAGLAHEINTPIQYVGDSVHFLREAFQELRKVVAAYRSALSQDLSTEGRQRLTTIHDMEAQIDFEFLTAETPRAFERTLEGIDRVAGIVSAMKEFAHPDACDQSAADLNHALETTLVVARNEYKYCAGVDSRFGLLPPVMCNIGELNQVFLNLIVNAAHAITDAGKDVADGRITVETRVVDSWVEVIIGDNGCGIAAENVEKIFDPFFTTKEVGRGTGQGLAIARAIVVDKHGGDIKVNSIVGAGTQFILRLPIAGQAGAGQDAVAVSAVA